MLLQDIRRHPSKGIIFHWSNYKHWRETAPVSSKDDSSAAKWFREHQYPRSSCRGLLAILQVSSTLQSTHELVMILEPSSAIIGAYFMALDQQAKTQAGAFSSIDGVEVFAAAIGLVYIIQLRTSATLLTAQPESAPQILLSIQRPLQLLTRISDRFTALRSLGEVLQAFALSLCNAPTELSASSSLRTILDTSLVTIPQPTVSLMLKVLELRYEQRT